MSNLIPFGQSDHPITIPANRINHHGFITGSTGSGKTVTMKVLCEQFMDQGIPVFVTDIKGDFSGITVPNQQSDAMIKRGATLKEEHYSPQGYQVYFWDIFREHGLPIRFSLSDLGPLFLAELLECNDAQANHLHSIFNFADQEGLLLIDFKDLISLVSFFSLHGKELTAYGNFVPQTLAAIERKLRQLEYLGAPMLFGEPSLDVKDLLKVQNGKGMGHIVDGRNFVSNPVLYSIFLTKLLSDLYEELEEVGNPDKPTFVLFFDEAHILFQRPSRQLLDKMNQAIRMIRSKGVGIYFVTQSPKDIPESILGQLGHRILHQMRAFTPNEIKGVKAAAQYLPTNPNFDTAKELTSLKIGEALTSMLQEDGSPTQVEKTMIYPPKSDFQPISHDTKISMIQSCDLYNKYWADVDPISAFELLRQKIQTNSPTTVKAKKQESIVDTTVHSFLEKMARQVGSELARNLFGGLKKR